jgi:hypothetical protein
MKTISNKYRPKPFQFNHHCATNYNFCCSDAVTLCWLFWAFFQDLEAQANLPATLSKVNIFIANAFFDF